MADDAPTIFGDLIRRARRAAGLSQEELAERAGLSARAISALERGINRAPRRDTLDMVADALGLAADERRRWEQLRRQEATRADTKSSTGRRQTVAATPTNLPAQPTRFFGRAHELDRLATMLRDEPTRLVTLTGPGGSGKTRLGQEVAASLLAEYPDGVFFVDLAPVSDVEQVIPTIATTLGLRPRVDQPPLTTLVEWMQGKRLLLILDNLEQILDAAPQIGELVAGTTDPRILATSRAPLRLRAEHEFAVPPLPLPPNDAIDGARTPAENDAVRMFIDRTRAVRPDFDAVDDDALVVARICRQLDGLPLAIELAAAGIRLFPLRAILSRLEDHLPLVAGSHRDAPARQRTLRDTIAWSYNLLQPADQVLLRRLSIFKGGWTLEAAEAVAGDAVPDVLGGSATLVEHNLIQSREWVDGEPRFSILETIREFGLAQLQSHGETDETNRRHAAYFLRINQAAAERIQSPRYRKWLERGDVEIENLRLALEWAVSHDPELAIRLAREVGWYLLTRGAAPEARQWLERALAAARQIPDDLRAGALNDLGMHAITYGEFEVADTVLEEALALYRQVGDTAGAANCQHNLGRRYMWSGNYDEAESLMEEAVVTLRQVDDSGLTVALANLGNVLHSLDKVDRAAATLDEALANGERRGDIWASVVILQGQSRLERERGNLPRARASMQRAMLLHRDLLDPRYIAQALEECAWLAVSEGATAHAARLLGAASRLRESIGVPALGQIRQAYERHLPTARAQLNAADWERAWSDGRALSQADAIDVALQGLE